MGKNERTMKEQLIKKENINKNHGQIVKDNPIKVKIEGFIQNPGEEPKPFIMEGDLNDENLHNKIKKSGGKVVINKETNQHFGSNLNMGISNNEENIDTNNDYKKKE